MNLGNRTLVTGVSGQLGRAVVSFLGAHRCIAAGRAALPLDFPEALSHRLDYLNPQAILNCAAYTAVDQAEKPEEELFVRAINEESPGRLARWCASRGIPLVHFSTDYVFDGHGTTRRSESDPTHPLNAYGRSKLAGEKAVLESGAKALVFRTSWVFDSEGKNFVNTMLALGAQRETLRVVADQVGAPTYAPHLAIAAVEALERALEIEARTGTFPSGVYHLCAGGETHWQAFAERIFEEARARGAQLAVKEVLPIASSEYPTPARRPLNSRLDCSRAAEVLGTAIPHWSHGLEECLDRKFSSSVT
ncbi:MAG: dTDP-4-dehydrorhamnose reductase [Oligoflexia bacterium]